MVRDSDHVPIRALARRRQVRKNGHMQITGAFLAQHAEIVDQKLNVTGGVLDWIGAPRAGQVDEWGNPIVATYFLVTLMQAGPDDHQKPYRMTTEAAHADGTNRFLAEATISVDAQIGENRFIVQRFGVNTEMSGRNVLVQTIDGGGSVALPVEVRVVDTHPS